MKITVDVRKDRDVVIVADAEKGLAPLPVNLTCEQARSLAIVLVHKLGMTKGEVFS
jgi:hypothetical protein